MSINKKKSGIYYLKAFAIISVVCAHISVVPEYFSFSSKYVCNLIYEVGSIGVGLFFAASGYLFYCSSRRNASVIEVMKDKAYKLGVPWLISATFVYIYESIRKGGSIRNYFLSICGYGSSYWYLSVLFILYIIYYYVSKSKKERMLLIVFPLLTIISIVLRGLSVVPNSVWGVYLNVFNWLIFFEMGIVFFKYKSFITNRVLKNRWIIWAGWLFVVSALLVMGHPKCARLSYFSLWYIPMEVVIIVLFTNLCMLLNNRRIWLLEYLGRMSFSIYLYNELLWAGLIVYLGNKVDNAYLLLLRPVAVLLMVCVEMEVGRRFFGLFNKKELFGRLVGIK